MFEYQFEGESSGLNENIKRRCYLIYFYERRDSRESFSELSEVETIAQIETTKEIANL